MIWQINKIDNPKFPYRLQIKEGKKNILVLLVADVWPGQKGNVFCLRETEEHENKELIEEINITALKQVGPRTIIVLDRNIHKRCDFLFIKKAYKTQPGEYEQIFWRTQKALRESRPKIRLAQHKVGELNIIIDSNEKYPYDFPTCITSRVKLKCGDYALMQNGIAKSVVERKTFENLIHDFAKLPVLHQRLAELAKAPHPALLIEANYSDFFNATKNKFYSPTFCAKILAEITMHHPQIQIVFVGTRKLAREWILRFFEAIG